VSASTELRPTFEVDKEGLAKVWARKGKGFVLTELLQNAWDEDISRVDMTFEYEAGEAQLAVEDDDPEGFTDLAHAYTLFAESEKKADVHKRGRFNLGEKLVIAVCETATIATTTGTVVFNGEGRRHGEATRERGSRFEGVIKMTREEYDEACEVIDRLIPPPDITTTFNGRTLQPRTPRKTWEVTMFTEISDERGNLKRTQRRTSVSVYEPEGGEAGAIYEMGIPVVETGDRWLVDVGQKVPLNVDRDNVTPAYLRELRRAVLDGTYDLLDGDTAQEGWVTNALEDPKVSREAVEAAVTQRYGDKVTRYDLHDTEANKIAASRGYHVLGSRALPKAAMAKVKEFGIALPSGQVTPSPKPYEPGQENVRQTLPEAEWSEGMRNVAAYSKAVAERLMAAQVTVEIVNDRDCMNFGATYGKGPGGTGKLEFNMRTLGRRWFDGDPTDPVIGWLIIHEFGHHYSGDHLSSDYHDAVCRLGARLARLALDEPEFFAPYMVAVPA
jgi:hypothetical protein